MQEKPNYYSILTACVRYDERLSSSEKLLYSEITALANKEGYCYATNGYFAKLYGCTESTISVQISNLAKCGYIVPVLEEGYKRRIYLNTGVLGKSNTPLVKNQKGVLEKSNPPPFEKSKHNNTSNNTKSIGKKQINMGKHRYGQYENVLLTDDELRKLKEEFPLDWADRIESVSGYCESTGKSYKNYLATIRNWARKEKKPVANSKNDVKYGYEQAMGLLGGDNG